MKFQKLYRSVLVGGILGLGMACAAYADFVGTYALGNWTQSLGPVGREGSITLTAPTSVKLTGFDDGGFNAGGDPGSTALTIAAATAGTVSFSWAYVSHEGSVPPDGPPNDPAGFFFNGPHQLTVDAPNNQDGSVSFAVLAGNTFGFYVNTLDGSYGAADLTITNFSFFASDEPPTGNVPEPGSLALLGLGLAGLGLMRKRLV